MPPQIGSGPIGGAPIGGGAGASGTAYELSLTLAATAGVAPSATKSFGATVTLSAVAGMSQTRTTTVLGVLTFNALPDAGASVAYPSEVNVSVTLAATAGHETQMPGYYTETVSLDLLAEMGIRTGELFEESLELDAASAFSADGISASFAEAPFDPPIRKVIVTVGNYEVRVL